MNNSKLHNVLEVDGVDPVLVVVVVAQLEVCKPEIESKLKIDFSLVTVGWGNFMIFLSLRFYVKSILENLQFLLFWGSEID